MDREGFVRKYGAAWHPPKGKGTVAIECREFPQEGIHQDYSYHVDRAKMDLLLLKHAEKLGSKIHQGTTVKKVLFDENQRANGVRVVIAGQPVTVPAAVVVDATGRGRLLGRQLRLQQNDPLFDQFCVHAWFDGVDRGPSDTEDYIHIYFLPIERGWAWQIPITDKISSIGVVAEKRVFARSKLDQEIWFKEQIKSAPEIEHAMRNARRINDFKADGDYSYSMKKLCGDGFMLIGDAARFVDPIFSSGVSVALYSAKVAAERIQEAFKENDFSEAVFKPYEVRVRKGVSIWYEFISIYYKLLPCFTYFIQNKQYRQQLFQLLQGEVYDRDEALPVLEAMRNYVDAVESTEGHMFKGALDKEIVLD
jgi:FADH2 O2-dependent halogenase